MPPEAILVGTTGALHGGVVIRPPHWARIPAIAQIAAA